MGGTGEQSNRFKIVTGARAVQVRSPTDQNNLLQWCQDNDEYGRKLIEEWAEPDLDMKDVMPATNKKLSWRCSAGCTKDGEAFTWEALVNNRTGSDRNGCPGCSGQSPTDQNNLLQWCQDNDEYGRKLIEEWAEPDLDMKDDARDEQEVVVEVLGRLHEGRGGVHVGGNGEQSHLLRSQGARAVQVEMDRRQIRTTSCSGARITVNTDGSLSRSGRSQLYA